MIKTCKAEAYAEIYVCDKCKTGEMKPTGENIWTVDPPLFKHKCDTCDEEKGLNEKYPVIKYRLSDI